jgi:transcriptional regulator with XRE-family HTH domain
MDGTDFFSAQTYLHRNIRFLRKAMGWSQEELAARVGLNRGNIASYENGTAEPKIGNLLKMSLLFGTSIHDLAHKDLEQEPIPGNTSLPPPLPLAFDPGALPGYASRAQELQDVMNGLRTCCKFKLKNIEEASVNDLQIVAMHFEELFNAAQSLMQEHLALLQLLDGCPSPTSPLPGQGNLPERTGRE